MLLCYVIRIEEPWIVEAPGMPLQAIDPNGFMGKETEVGSEPRQNRTSYGTNFCLFDFIVTRVGQY